MQDSQIQTLIAELAKNTVALERQMARDPASEFRYGRDDANTNPQRQSFSVVDPKITFPASAASPINIVFTTGISVGAIGIFFSFQRGCVNTLQDNLLLVEFSNNLYFDSINSPKCFVYPDLAVNPLSQDAPGVFTTYARWRFNTVLPLKYKNVRLSIATTVGAKTGETWSTLSSGICPPWQVVFFGE